MLATGCGHLNEGSSFREAGELFGRGDYTASINKYEWIVARYPDAADRALFEMGIIYAYPGNEQKDYLRSLKCFQKILNDYPASRYRQDSAEMMASVESGTIKDMKISAQQTRIASLEQEMKERETLLGALRQRVAALENENSMQQQKIAVLEESLDSGKTPVSRVLIEKAARRLSLISKGKALRTYRIALGGNPKGPKERQGDNRTPEGTTSSTEGTGTAPITYPCISPIPMRRT
jgi:tetratricopeptide (TPR) repeat protein